MATQQIFKLESEDGVLMTAWKGQYTSYVTGIIIFFHIVFV